MKLGGLRALALAGMVAVVSCQAADGPDPAPAPNRLPPGPVLPTTGTLQPAGVLYQSELWTRPPEALFGASTCRSRRSVPGCGLFAEPSVVAMAIAGQRLVVLMERDRLAAIAGWDLLVSEDLGTTVRRFPLDGLPGDGREASLHLHAGRIFLLASFTDPVPPARGGARVFEIDLGRGTFAAVGGAASMSSASGVATPDGALTTVAFGRDRPPQVISVTRFDPAAGSIRRDDLACDVTGCDPASLAYPFLSGDAETFDILVSPVAAADSQSCLLTVNARQKTVASECFPRVAPRNVVPVSAQGGTPYDFQFSTADGDGHAWLLPVNRHWLPSGAPQLFASAALHARGGALFVFSPSAFGTDGDTVVLRLLAGGKLQKTVVQHQGCLNLGPYTGRPQCPKLVALRALSGDELLLITQREEFEDEGRSRQRFEVARSAAPFVDFQR